MEELTMKPELIPFVDAIPICRECENKFICNKSPFSTLQCNLKVFDCDKLYVKNNNNKEIKIKIENYNDENRTFIMPDIADVSVQWEIVPNEKQEKIVTGIEIKAKWSDGIKVKKEYI